MCNASAGCLRRMAIASSRSSGPVIPITVLAAMSCSRSTNTRSWRRTVHPVKARATSEMSRSENPPGPTVQLSNRPAREGEAGFPFAVFFGAVGGVKRGLGQHFPQHLVEAAQGVLSQGADVPQKQRGIRQPFHAHPEEPMPEESHLFQQGMRRLDHSPQPPVSQDGRFGSIVARRFECVLLPVERIEVSLGLEQPFDRGRGSILFRYLELFPVRPKPGSAVQVPRVNPVPGFAFNFRSNPRRP